MWGAAAAAADYPITFTTTLNGTATFDLSKTGVTPVWTPGDGSADVEAAYFSHAYDGGTYDGYAAFDDYETASALFCWVSGLTSLTVSALTSCANLRCHNNSLPDLILPSSALMTNLECGTNLFTEIDLSVVPNLETFSCTFSKLTSLGPSDNSALSTIGLSGSADFTSLDSSGYTALASLDVSTTPLTSLDVSSNTALVSLNCAGCTLLSALSVSANTELTTLWGWNNGWSETVVNSLLAELVANNKTNGSCRLHGSNAAPTGQGIIDVATLEGRGWAMEMN